jgi:hypothetical protein
LHFVATPRQGYDGRGTIRRIAYLRASADMNRLTPSLDHWLDRALGLTVGISLATAVLSAWPTSTHATDMVVGNGQRVSETRTLGEFTAIAVSGAIGLKLKQGEQTQVVVNADSNLLPLIELSVDGEKALRVRWKPGTSIRPHGRVWIDVLAPKVQAVSSTGSSDIEIDSVRTPQLALSIAGSGGLRAKGLQQDELTIGVTGSGGVQAAGQAGRLRITISGSGDVRANELAANEVSVNISGSGDAAVNAAKTLNVAVAGSGDVVYTGSPAVNQAIAGSGSVRKR